ncbi:MAG: leucine-rich repeat protein, partial [Alistipes sp.]|nr:leucine-rich repeat protein [Alistipes sp.]
LNNDGNYTLYTTSTSATKGMIKITAKIPTANRVIVSVSDGNHTIMTAIDVTLKQPTITVTTPGTLAELIANYDKTSITELTVIGNLNSSDILTLKELPNLAVLDLENVHLEKLPEQAFYDNKSLTSVKLPISLIEIEREAFSGCISLTDITIPESVTSIGNGGFYDCINLTNVYITNIEKWCTIKFDVYSNPLYYAHNLYLNGELVTDLVIPDSITSIGDHVFSGCSSITSITIPNSVTFIGNEAFRGCNSLTSINIPNSIISIGIQAFLNCNSLTNVYITDITKWCAIEFHDNTSTPLGHTTHNYLYLREELVTDLIIPDSVTSIGNYTFYGCISMKSITIPNSVTSIGRLAFYRCSALININIPNSVMTIGYGAFMRCHSLTSITIGDGVTSIESYAFSDCNSLTSIYCKAQTPPAIDSSSFYDWSQCTLYVPTGNKEAYATADHWEDAKEIIEMEF